MAIDGLGGSTPPLTPPAGGDAGGVGGAGNTNGTNPVTGATTLPPLAPVPNVISPAISAPKANVSPLDRPKIEIPANMNLSVGDLIQLIQSEIKKTSDAIAEVQKSQIKADTLKQTNANDAQIKALNDAADQIAQIQEEQEAMADVQWALMALSIFLTVCTAGGLGPFIGPIMVAATVVTQVPIEGKNFSGWLTEGVGKGLGELEKACMRSLCSDYGSNGYKMTDQEKTDANKQIEDSETYQAMAIMTAIEVTVAIVVAVVTFGAAAGPAAGAASEAITEETLTTAANQAEVILEEAMQTAMQEAANTTAETLETTMNEVEQTTAETLQTTTNEVATTTQETAQSTLEDVADVGEDVGDSVADNAKQLQQFSKIQRYMGNVQTVGGVAKDLALDGVQIHTAYLQYENSENQADADKIKAYTKFLQQVLSSEEDFLKQIIESQSNIADTVKDILQTEHSTNMHIANLTTHA